MYIRIKINKPAANTTGPAHTKVKINSDRGGEGNRRPSQLNNNRKSVGLFQYIPSTRWAQGCY
jgi:hypothetical protein